MPELPEVQTIVTTLDRVALGCSIVGVEVIRADYVRPGGFTLPDHLMGRRIAEIQRFGKRIIFTLDDGMHMLIHLGMTGRLTLHPPLAARAPHTHLVLSLRPSDGRLREMHLRDPRRFGEVRWLGALPGNEGLGVEPLQMTARELASVLARSKRPIKSLLLDQSKIAGLGNIYADESLFLAGIHPLWASNRIGEDRAADLCRSIKLVLRKALKHRGSTLRDYVDAEGNTGGFQSHHNVYGRSGQPCPKCRNNVQKVVLAGRSTCFCPNCQPLP